MSASTTETSVAVQQPVEEVSSESGLKSFLSGGFGGVCLVLVGHPLDLIKVRVQAAASGTLSQSPLTMLRETFAKEGIRGLYRGVSAPIVAVAPIFAISFWGFDTGKRLMRWCDTDDNKMDPDYHLTVPQLCVAGGLSAIPTTVIMAPSERIKCLLQMQQSNTTNVKPKYSGMMDCAKQLYIQGGMKSLYKGTGATLLRDVPGSIIYFGVYEVLKRNIIKFQDLEDPSQISPLAVITAGGLAGMTCWIVQIPPDVLKSRYQTAEEGTYKNLKHVYVKLVKEEGYGALYRGIGPAMLRAFPANAACFMGMEVAKSFLSFMD